MSNNLKFSEHVDITHSKGIQLINWVLRTFKTRDPLPMITLWRSLILSRIDYCSQLLSAINNSELQKLEGLQRTFTSRITCLKDFNYWDRLKSLELFSIERRFERYLIIYLWKISEGIVPNPTPNCPLNLSESTSRTGRKFYISTLPQTSRYYQTQYHNSPIPKAKRLFNRLPKPIRNITNCRPHTFKIHLDMYLKTVPDEPRVPGYAQFSPVTTNSLIDQITLKGGVPDST